MDSAKQTLIEEALRQGKPYKEIASQYRVSFRDISRVAREIRQLSPSDIFDMVVDGMNPREIADETGADLAELKSLYEDSVELLEYMNRQSKALKELRGAELYKRLKADIQRRREQKESGEGETDSQKERELLAKVVGVRYVCANPKCRSPLTGAPDKLERCPTCGCTQFRDLEDKGKKKEEG